MAAQVMPGWLETSYNHTDGDKTLGRCLVQFSGQGWLRERKARWDNRSFPDGQGSIPVPPSSHNISGARSFRVRFAERLVRGGAWPEASLSCRSAHFIRARESGYKLTATE